MIQRKLLLCYAALASLDFLSFPLVSAECLDPAAIWCEEFNTPGIPNPEYWSFDYGAGGWGNAEVQTYVDQNAMVQDDGNLHIQVTRNGDAFFSSRINTDNKVSFKYVGISASIKITDLTGGLWPAIWLLGTNYGDIGWPYCGEIDIAEWGSKAAIASNELHSTVSGACHWDEDDTHTFDFKELVVDSKLTDDFHIYSLNWTPTDLTMYLDGQLVFTKNITDLEAFHEPFFLLLNVAVGGHFTGIYTPTSLGGEMLVDWVRVYDNGFGSSVTIIDSSGTSSFYQFSLSWFCILGFAASVLFLL